MTRQSDIAKELGISISTVSRALSGSPQISAKTRDSVLRMASQLDYPASTDDAAVSYLPADAARWIDRPATLSVLINRDLKHRGAGNDIFSDRPLAPAWDLLSGVTHEARQLGFSINVHFFSESEADSLSSSEEHLPRELTGGDRDQLGVLVIRRFPDAVCDWLAERFRTVFLCQPAGNREADCVDLDVVLAMSRAYRHLHDLGHRQIGFVQSEPMTCGTRFSAFLKAAVVHGQPITPQTLLNVHRPLDPDRLAKQLVQATAAGTSAWICVGGADAVVRSLIDAGLEVPRDVSILAVAQDSPSIHGRKVSHVTYDVQPVGRAGLRVLLDRLREPDQPTRSVLLQPGVVAGETTAPPR